MAPGGTCPAGSGDELPCHAPVVPVPHGVAVVGGAVPPPLTIALAHDRLKSNPVKKGVYTAEQPADTQSNGSLNEKHSSGQHFQQQHTTSATTDEFDNTVCNWATATYALVEPRLVSLATRWRVPG